MKNKDVGTAHFKIDVELIDREEVEIVPVDYVPENRNNCLERR